MQITKRKHSITFLLTVASLVGISNYTMQPNRANADSTDLIALHKQYVQQYYREMQSGANSGLSTTYYSTSYYLHGMLSAVEATGDVTELKQVIALINTMIDKAVPVTVNGVTYQVWGPLDANGMPYQLHTFQGASAIARAAAIINAHPQWKATYATAAQRFIDFVDGMVIRFWFDKTVGVYKVSNPATWPYAAGQIAWLPTNLGGWGSHPIWSDKCSLLGTTATHLYHATTSARKTVYLDISNRVATGFRLKLTARDTGRGTIGWLWDNGLPLSTWVAAGHTNQSAAHDTSHANREAEMMVAMHEAGLEFTLQDVEKMANTLVDIIWNQSLADPAFTNYIDGGNEPFGADGPYSIGTLYHGWAYLGRYVPRAQGVLERVLTVVRGGKLPGVTVGRYNFSGAGKVELTGHLLRNRGCTGRC